MKKQTLKNLSLNKKTISNFKKLNEIHGGADETLSLSDCDTSIRSFLKYCPEPTPFSDPAICTGGWGECPIF
jgi:hypothetical protein